MDKYGLYEIGTTNVRLTLASGIPNGHFHIDKSLSEHIHINEHIATDGLIHSAKIHEVATILKMYKKVAEAEGVQHFNAVVAESLTGAKNYKSFVDELSAVIGYELKILTKDEETNAIYTAVVNTLDVAKGVILNISSFNTRIIHYNRRMIIDSITVPFGSVSLMEAANNMPLVAIDTFKKALDTHAEFFKCLDPETQIVGVGDVFMSFARIARKLKRYPIDIDHNFVADTATFHTVFDFVKGLDVEKKQKLKGISGHSAKTILCGMCIIEAVLKASGIKTMVNACAYRNVGLLYNAVVPSTIEKPINDLLGYSIDVIADMVNMDKDQARRHYDLSLMLFKNIRVLHKLPRYYAKPLRIASMLYYLGRFTNRFHTIQSAPLLGVSHKEILLAAFASSFRKWEDFNLAEWIKYNTIMTDEDLDAVRKISMILALAEAFDIRGSEIIRDISCDLLGDSVILKLVTGQDARNDKVDVLATDVEIFHAKKYAGEFARTFKRSMELL